MDGDTSIVSVMGDKLEQVCGGRGGDRDPGWVWGFCPDAGRPLECSPRNRPGWRENGVAAE